MNCRLSEPVHVWHLVGPLLSHPSTACICTGIYKHASLLTHDINSAVVGQQVVARVQIHNNRLPSDRIEVLVEHAFASTINKQRTASCELT